jgi:hypothetical protein
MKLAVTVAALGMATLFGTISAQAAGLEFGPGGVRVDPGHRYDRSYNRGECRTIIDHHMNARGENVTVRRRVCD